MSRQTDRDTFTPPPACKTDRKDRGKDSIGGQNNEYLVRCDECGGCGPIAFSEDEAIKNWNGYPNEV